MASYNFFQCICNRVLRAMELGDKKSEFVTINNVTKEIKHHFSLFKDIVADMNDIDIEFKIRDNTPCIPLMQLNFLRHRLMQHFTKVGGNGERYVDDHVNFIGINARMSVA